MIDKDVIDPEPKARELANKVIDVKPLLMGGTTKIAFLNIHGAPTKSTNLDKIIPYQYLTAYNDMTVLLETGCSRTEPDLMNV